MIRRFRRHIAFACAGLLLLATGIVLSTNQQDAQAADAADFQAGYLISDENFYDDDSMTVSQIQDFLNKRGANCTGNCLKDKRVNTTSKAANKYCGAYKGARGESAAQVISKVGKSCGISPKVLIVMLEKETSLVTMDNPAEWRYDRAMGYYCPDDPNRPGWCNPEYAGLYNQLYRAAWQFNQYAANRGDYAYVAGRNNSILYNPDRSCGASNVYIKNQATASLYIYTPYQPNQAALSNLYGTGNGCSTYGNRNFWRLYTDWFGSPTAAPKPAAHNPQGAYDTLVPANGGFRVRGWAVDADKPKTSLKVHIKFGDRKEVVTAKAYRPDVEKAISVAGPNQGFDKFVKAKPGTYRVCVTAINVGGGKNKSLGCKSVKVAAPKPKPTETAKPKPTESVKPTPTETSKPKPTESVKPTPTETAKPVPSETAKPKPSETSKPKPSETTKPTSTAKPSEPEVIEPSETAAAGTPSGVGGGSNDGAAHNSSLSVVPNHDSKDEPAETPSENTPSAEPATPEAATPAEPAKQDESADETKSDGAAPAEQAPQQLSVIPDEDAAQAPDDSSSDASELAATGAQPMATPVLVALGVLLASAAALLGMRVLRRES